ncbi:DUF937 domain-containing protein [Snodgrassella sp. CFCC 13594]|uniref:DUF937 domain-containing protein n=1 Tax=Snodgrassella sp. CFCC 13594 TaxID=1775559 RepID=UPI000837A133|nr:DUF937 domain-containing protein [Snodgrassella sp. CFCC 13594]
MTNATSLIEQLQNQLQGAPMQQIAQQLGADTQTTEQAVNAAIPLLLGKLGQNAEQPQGAESLFNALQDHAQPSVASLAGGDVLGGLLNSVLGSSGAQSDGASILGHIFGNQKGQVADALGQSTGLGSNSNQLLSILAPIVMAFLAKQVSSKELDAGGLGQTLGQASAQAQQQGGLGGSLLSGILDQNGDGKLDLGDLLKLGTSFLGGKR